MLEQFRKSPAAQVGLLAFFALALVVFFISNSGQGTEKEGELAKSESLLGIMDRGKVAGGLGDIRPKDDQSQKVVDSIKSFLEQKLNKTFKSLEVIHYRSQIVAGRNYFAKVRATEEGGQQSIMHLRIYEPLPHTKKEPELSAYQTDKTENEAVEYFQ